MEMHELAFWFYFFFPHVLAKSRGRLMDGNNCFGTVQLLCMVHVPVQLCTPNPDRKTWYVCYADMIDTSEALLARTLQCPPRVSSVDNFALRRTILVPY